MHNIEYYSYAENVKRGAWGYADYERKLEPHEVFRYELVGGNAVDNVIPQ